MDQQAYPQEPELRPQAARSDSVEDLVYPRERTLGALTLVLGVLGWLMLVAGTFGAALLFLGVGFVAYVFAHSALIAHVKGNGVELSEAQFPDLYRQFVACCDRLHISPRPQIYILNGNGGLNAFATKFLGTEFVILLADVVDAMDAHPDGVSFYIGHELGHLRMKHLSGQFWRWPVAWLPLIGAAYSRARESTCDRHGKACSSSPENAARALAALSAGVERWKLIDLPSLLRQTSHSSGFWMSFHELTAGYPWLTKRVARVMDANAPMPGRHGLAYFFALFIPYAGRLGAGFGFLMLVYVLGATAAIAIPAFVTYTTKAKLESAVIESQAARAALSAYYDSNQATPESLESLNIATQLGMGMTLTLEPEEMVLTVHTEKGDMVFTPMLDAQQHILWSCSNGEGLKAEHLPNSCTEMAPAEP